MFAINDINKVAPGLIDKLMQLYEYLKEEKSSCEQISQRFTDKQMQRSIITLAQESNQYASEVYGQICSLGGKIPGNLDLSDRKKMEDLTSNSDEANIDEVCSKSESKLLNFYKEMMEDPLLLAELRRMFKYQMDGLLSCISQLKLLRHSMYKS